jgi:hypothetical protein
MAGYNLELLRGKPIPFESGFLHFPTLREICDGDKYGGIDGYNTMLLPFRVNYAYLKVPDDQQIGHNFFETVIMNQLVYLQLVTTALMVFFECDDIGFTAVSIRIGEVNVTKDNWDALAECVRTANCVELLKPPEEAPEDARKKDIFEKLNKGRARYEEKHGTRFEDILNFLMHGPGRMYPIEELEGMTIWQIMNAFDSKMQVLDYQQCFRAAIISGDTKGIKDKNSIMSRLRLKS